MEKMRIILLRNENRTFIFLRRIFSLGIILRSLQWRSFFKAKENKSQKQRAKSQEPRAKSFLRYQRLLFSLAVIVVVGMESAGLARAAVRFDNSADGLSRTTDLPATSSFTMMGWVQIVVDNNNWSGIFYLGRNDAYNPAEDVFLQTNVDGTTLVLDPPTGVALGLTELIVGTWYHLAMVKSGNDYTAYLNGSVNIQTTDSGAITNARLELMNDPLIEPINGRMCAVKVWSTNLTQAEVQNEMRSYRPKRTANLYGWWPMLTTSADEVDFSGNGRNWTVGGTLATEDGPPVSWK